MDRKFVFIAVVSLALCIAPALQAGEPMDAKAAFEKLKSLAGEWHGSTADGTTVPMIFKVTANGSVVLETQFAGSDHEMINAYHLVGNDLIATHYCAARNQPQLKLDLEKSTPTELVFAFDGGTNLDPAKDAHIHGARLTLGSDGRLNEEWTFYAGGKEQGAEKFSGVRK